MASNELMEAAAKALKTADISQASRLLKMARAKGDEEVAALIEESGLISADKMTENYRDSRAFADDIQKAIDIIESRTRYKLKNIDEQIVRHSSAKSISFNALTTDPLPLARQLSWYSHLKRPQVLKNLLHMLGI